MTAGAPPVLEARAVTAGHGGRAVVREASLALLRGRVLCLLGPNGGGKTTLLRTLLGLIPPLAGGIFLDGAPPGPPAAVARRLAYVPQATTGGLPLTVLDAVLLGRAAHLPFLAVPGGRDRRAALDALSRIGCDHLAGRRVTELSGGERQLVLLARALAQDAGALILDEPTASLDLGNAVLVLRRIREAAATGLAVLFTTHAPDHALMIADAVAVVREGRLYGPDSPARMITAEGMLATYGVAVAVAQLDTPAGPRPVCLPLLDVPPRPGPDPMA